MSSLPDESQLFETLSRLGNTDDEVASELREMGICGTQEDEERCPVARYLSSVYDCTYCPSVNIENVSIFGPDYMATPLATIIATPPAIAAFIINFDEGDYPELIDPELIGG